MSRLALILGGAATVLVAAPCLVLLAGFAHMLHVTRWSVDRPSEDECDREARRVRTDPLAWLHLDEVETEEGVLARLTVTPPTPVPLHFTPMPTSEDLVFPGVTLETPALAHAGPAVIESLPITKEAFDAAMPLWTSYGWAFHPVPDAREIERPQSIDLEFPVHDGRIVHFVGARERNFIGAPIWPDSHKAGDLGAEYAVDVAAPLGTPVVAGIDGVVVYANDRYRDLGCSGRSHPDATNRLMILSDGGDYWVTYAHLQQGSLKVVAGDRVRRGQVVAAIGNSGLSWTPHLHLSVDTLDQRGPVSLPFEFRCRGEPVPLLIGRASCEEAQEAAQVQSPSGGGLGQSGPNAR